MIVENTSRWNQDDFEELINTAVALVAHKNPHKLDSDGTIICVLSHWTGKAMTITTTHLYNEVGVVLVKIPRPARFKKGVIDQLADLADGTAEDLPHEWMPQLGAAIISLILGHEKDTRYGMDMEPPYNGAWAANMRLRATPKRANHTSFRKARQVLLVMKEMNDVRKTYTERMSELDAELVCKQDALQKAQKKESA